MADPVAASGAAIVVVSVEDTAVVSEVIGSEVIASDVGMRGVDGTAGITGVIDDAGIAKSDCTRSANLTPDYDESWRRGIVIVRDRAV